MKPGRKLVLSLLLILSATGQISGCNSIMGPINTPPMHTYTLQYRSYPNPINRNKLVTLMLTTPTASPGYQNKKMIYSTQPYELNNYSKNQWAGPPAEMLKPMLVQAIRDTGYFHAVIASPISADSNMRLKLNVLELRHDYTVKPSQIRLSAQATLVNDRNDKVIASEVFSADTTAPCPTPYGGVIAANQAANRLLRQVARFCVRYIVHPQIPTSTYDKQISLRDDLNLPEPTVIPK